MSSFVVNTGVGAVLPPRRRVEHVNSALGVRTRGTGADFVYNIRPVGCLGIKILDIQIPYIYYECRASKNQLRVTEVAPFASALITLPVGNYSAPQLGVQLQNTLTTAFGAGLYTVFYNSITGKYVISRVAGNTFTLEFDHATVINPAHELFGFTKANFASAPAPAPDEAPIGTGMPAVGLPAIFGTVIAKPLGDDYLLLYSPSMNYIEAYASNSTPNAVYRRGILLKIPVSQNPLGIIEMDNTQGVHFPFATRQLISRLEFTLLHPNFEVVDLNGGSFSLTVDFKIN